MTGHQQDDLIGWTLFAIAWLILVYFIAEQVIQHLREERGRKPRTLPGALGASMEARIAETWPGWVTDECGCSEAPIHDPYDKVVWIQGHRHSEPVCAWPDCQTYLTRTEMAAMPEAAS